MSYSRSDYDGDDGFTDCPSCQQKHPPNFRLINCAERTCEAVGCYECFPRCEVSNSCGRFCDQHISEIDLGTPEHPMKVQACVRCEAEELDIEDGADQIERVAA